jgi:membrane protein YqaA with SNARE-associated domain
MKDAPRPTPDLDDVGAALEGAERIPLPSERVRHRVRTALFVVQIVFIATLLGLWIGAPALRQSKSLWVLFLYCFPAEFLVATVPHEPVLLFFSKFYGPLTIALVSIAGTALTEVINYSVFRYVADLKVFRKMLESRGVQKLVAWFKKAPFLSLWVAGFTPIPFYPFRFLVVLARYPLWKYILAVITSRTPRFYILGLAGGAIKFSDELLFLLTAVLLSVGVAPILAKLIRKRRRARIRPPSDSVK